MKNFHSFFAPLARWRPCWALLLLLALPLAGRAQTAPPWNFAAAGSPDQPNGSSTTRAVATDASGYVVINRHCQSNVPTIYAAGAMSGKLPLSSVASMQGRKVAGVVRKGRGPGPQSIKLNLSGLGLPTRWTGVRPAGRSASANPSSPE